MLLRFNPWAQRTFKRICEGQKTWKKTAIVAVARKLLVRCWTMLRHHQAWTPDDHVLIWVVVTISTVEFMPQKRAGRSPNPNLQRRFDKFRSSFRRLEPARLASS